MSTPMGRRKKALLSRALLPVVRALHQRDRTDDNTFASGCMITGLYGVCRK